LSDVFFPRYFERERVRMRERERDRKKMRKTSAFVRLFASSSSRARGKRPREGRENREGKRDRRRERLVCERERNDSVFSFLLFLPDSRLYIVCFLSLSLCLSTKEEERPGCEERGDGGDKRRRKEKIRVEKSAF